jgi:predicted  nucleic acid-binding Zn-ribbon protein
MWKELWEFGKQLLSLTRETQQSKADIASLQRELKEVRQELRMLAEAVHFLRFEQQRDRENAAHEREKLLLRLENAFLRLERRLPPAGSGDETREPGI